MLKKKVAKKLQGVLWSADIDNLDLEKHKEAFNYIKDFVLGLRDYVDLFFFLKWKVFDLDTIIAEAEERFAGEFNDKLFLEQLSYFEDFKITPIDYLQESYTPKQIQEFLRAEVEKYTQKRLTSKTGDVPRKAC